MNRLGFAAADIELLAKHIADSKTLHVQSVFTHLAASEEAAQDAYTLQQSDLFKQAVSIIEHCLPYHFLKHIANSAAIVRHPQLQMDMVRLGIGLYGIEVDDTNVLELQQVATLRSTIAQLKSVPANSSVSYNRKGIVKRDTLVATVRIGYADGYSRRFGHGKGKMLVRGRLAPVIGTVCMDMTMIDVTDIPLVQEGDEVIIFDAALPIQEIAGWIDAIPYEIMTGISQRVKRIYYHG
jgi:alanine racemase